MKGEKNLQFGKKKIIQELKTFFMSFIIIKEEVTIMEIGPLKQTLLLWFGKIGRGNDFSPYLVAALTSEERPKGVCALRKQRQAAVTAVWKGHGSMSSWQPNLQCYS